MKGKERNTTIIPLNNWKKKTEKKEKQENIFSPHIPVSQRCKIKEEQK